MHPLSMDMCLEAWDPYVVLTAKNYTVTVYTGNRAKAGTDAEVYITLFGQAGDCAEQQIDTPADDFEAGAYAYFSPFKH